MHLVLAGVGKNINIATVGLNFEDESRDQDFIKEIVKLLFQFDFFGILRMPPCKAFACDLLLVTLSFIAKKIG